MEPKQLNKDEHPVGTRLLARDGQSTTIFSTVYEITIQEWSPSGEIVKVKNENGYCYWKQSLPYVVEVLDRAHMEKQWRDIKSAPLDRPFLGYGIFAGEIGGISKSPSIGVVEGYTEQSDYDGFHWVAANTDAYMGWWKLTHWMELSSALEGIQA